MFNFFKKKQELIINSPLTGIVFPLSEFPDPAFAQGMLGEGLCIQPSEHTVYTPIDGEINVFHTLHAFGIQTKNIELIVHVGAETVNLQGEGFSALSALEGFVKSNTPVISFDEKVLIEKTGSTKTAFVISDKPESATIEFLKTSGDVVAGEALIKITY